MTILISLTRRKLTSFPYIINHRQTTILTLQNKIRKGTRQNHYRDYYIIYPIKSYQSYIRYYQNIQIRALYILANYLQLYLYYLHKNLAEDYIFIIIIIYLIYKEVKGLYRHNNIIYYIQQISYTPQNILDSIIITSKTYSS